jgi:hypothetical protein
MIVEVILWNHRIINIWPSIMEVEWISSTIDIQHQIKGANIEPKKIPHLEHTQKMARFPIKMEGYVGKAKS